MTLPVIDLERKWHTVTTRKYMQPGEIEVLLTLADSVQPTSMIEIGVNEGRTAEAVLANIPTIERYVGVDAPPGYKFEIPAQSNEQPDDPGHMVKDDPRFELILRGDDTKITGLFDVSFIDGDHGYTSVLRDYNLSRRLVRSGGIIIFHDYSNGTVEVTQALEQIASAGTELFHIRNTWLVYERIS